jgi:membrane-associated protein
MTFSEFFTLLTNSQEIILTGGLILITLIVYAENGLFFGFFLPGDYLLFSAGLLCGTGNFNVSIFVLWSCLFFASVLGSYTGYLFGLFLGKNLLNKPDSIFFKKEYLVKTRYYYIKYAGNTLIVGRFLPIVRTFAPILAGLIRMNQKKFLFFNILGAFLWVTSLVVGGYYLGVQFPQILDYLEYIIFGFVAITSFVVIKGMLSSKKKGTKKLSSEDNKS